MSIFYMILCPYQLSIQAPFYCYYYYYYSKTPVKSVQVLKNCYSFITNNIISRRLDQWKFTMCLIYIPKKNEISAEEDDEGLFYLSPPPKKKKKTALVVWIPSPAPPPWLLRLLNTLLFWFRWLWRRSRRPQEWIKNGVKKKQVENVSTDKKQHIQFCCFNN